MRVELVVEPHLERLLEHGDDIGAVGRRYKVERTDDLLNEFVATGGGLFVHVDFVSDDHAGNVRAVVAQLLVPVLQVLISDFAVCVKHQDADVRSVVVGGMQLIEGLLARCVPDVCREQGYA